MPKDSDLFYADESGFDEYFYREYGYAPRGKKVIGEVSGRKFARTSIVAAWQNCQSFAPFAYKGSMNSDLFEGWLENVFVPCINIPSKTALVIDNASVHNKDRIFDIADEYGFKVIFLPPYSPDLNPIEKFWANVKKRLRYGMHNFNSFFEALSHAFY